jgi:hypothetical protein
MSSDSMLLDPEVEGLLREVAADPHSSLLRVPRGKAVPALYEDQPAAGPATAGLSAAEREILRVHRFEVACLLMEACLLKLVQGSDTRMYVSKFVTATVTRAPIHREDLLRGLRSHTTGEPGTMEVGDSMVLLARVVADCDAGVPTIAELAASAHRLQPSNRSRVLAAQDMAIHQSPRAALLLLRTVLGATPSSSIQLSAWSAIGLACLDLGDHHSAQIAYKNASQLDTSRPGTWMDRLAVGLQVGDVRDVTNTSHHLSIILRQDIAALEWYVVSRAHRRRVGQWTPTAAASQLAASIRENVDTPARRICDVFV